MNRSLLTAGVLLWSLAGCATEATAPEQVQSIVSSDISKADMPDGATLFEDKCAMCHRAMGMGTVLLSRRDPSVDPMIENRNDLNAETITAIVRYGIGSMPQISRGELSDAELSRISSYLSKEAPQ